MAVAFFRKSMLADYIPEGCFLIPNDPDGEYKRELYPHFEVFSALHLGTGMDYSIIESNAEVIGKIEENKIKTITLEELVAMGCVYYVSDYWD